MRSFTAASEIKWGTCRKSTERQWKLCSNSSPRWKLSFSNLRVNQPQKVCIYTWKPSLFMFSYTYVTQTHSSQILKKIENVLVLILWLMNFGFAHRKDIVTILDCPWTSLSNQRILICQPSCNRVFSFSDSNIPCQSHDLLDSNIHWICLMFFTVSHQNVCIF